MVRWLRGPLLLSVALALPASAQDRAAPAGAPSPPVPDGGAAAAEPGVSFRVVDAELDEAEYLIYEAFFEEALEALETPRATLAPLADREGAPARRARLEVLTATAELALGREADARRSLRRALGDAPGLQLADSTPPKVRRALEAVRAAR